MNTPFALNTLNNADRKQWVFLGPLVLALRGKCDYEPVKLFDTPHPDLMSALDVIFLDQGITDHASYLVWRDQIRSELRELPAKIRAAKLAYKAFQRGEGRYPNELSTHRSRFDQVLALRILGKAWSAKERNQQKAVAA